MKYNTETPEFRTLWKTVATLAHVLDRIVIASQEDVLNSLREKVFAIQNPVFADLRTKVLEAIDALIYLNDNERPVGGLGYDLNPDDFDSTSETAESYEVAFSNASFLAWQNAENALMVCDRALWE